MNIKKNRTIGIRTDEHFIKLLETASEIYNTSKSEILRNAVMQCYGLNVIQHKNAVGVSRPVRRQSFWNQRRLKLRESLAHLVGIIMRRAGGDASVAFRVSFV